MNHVCKNIVTCRWCGINCRDWCLYRSYNPSWWKHFYNVTTTSKPTPSFHQVWRFQSYKS